MTLILTSCTNRKRYQPEPHLDTLNLPRGTLEETASNWISRRNKADTHYEAGSLYVGRPMKDARNAAQQINTSPYIISAGMGLISILDAIPSYNLTVQSKSQGSIQKKIIEPIRPMDWWRALNTALDRKNPVAGLVKIHKRELTLIACPEVYAQMISDDVLTLNDEDISTIRIFGPRTPDNFPVRFRNLIMPYDERFDGPDSPLPGTRTDYPQRVLLHFVKDILPGSSSRDDITVHRDSIEKRMETMRRPALIRRTPLNDEQIIHLIRNCWETAEGKSSKMLRVLRDREKVACEQGRFANLFKLAKERHSL